MSELSSQPEESGKDTAPRFALSEPYNPNVVGRLRKPPEDTASMADHLTPHNQQDRGLTVREFHKRLEKRKDHSGQQAANTPTNTPPQTREATAQSGE